MDQATVAEPVDLLQGLSNTIAVLQSKARHKSAAIAVHPEPGLPRVFGFPGELNQIWANLIDNALDALQDGGRIDIEAMRDGQRVAVRIIDNGPGIPDAVRDRIFDPFFTTKPMGQGTGLGLDIVRRLLLPQPGRHHGRVEARTDGIPRGLARRERGIRGVVVNKPFLLVVDDDPQVLAAVRRDLRSRYRDNYTVVGAPSGDEALAAMRELKSRGDALAMVISDQRMPGMLGNEVLATVREVYPVARRVLLTAYSDVNAAIKAINEAHVDHYLAKPWDPPEDKLYPVVDDLLEAWKAESLPEAAGLRLVGHQWSPRSHAIKDFLAGNLIPYRWLDVERDPETHACSRPSASPMTICRRFSSRTARCSAIHNRATSRSAWGARCRPRSMSTTW